MYRSNKKIGFTLMELMVAISIMLVLFGVGAPATKAIQNRLAWTKANGIAKEIFMVAQNQAIHMRSNSSLDLKGATASGNLNPDAISSFASEVEKNTNHKVVTKPSDYKKSNAKYKNLYYITSNQSGAMSYIVPNLTQQSITGAYLIEVNPRSGDVYGVFYSDTLSSAQLLAAYEAGTKTSTGASLSEDAFRPESFRKKYMLNGEEHMIGYYGGSEAGLSGDNSEGLTIQAFNKEQLYVKVNVPHALFDNISEDNFSIDFLISDEHGNSIIRSGKSAAGGDWNKPALVKADNGSVDVYLILDDSINSTAHKFTSLNKGLTAGDDISITAQASYVSNDSLAGERRYITTQYSNGTSTVVVNSLFGAGTEISDDAAVDTIIKVANCRHLRNLENIRNDATWAKNNSTLRTTQLVKVDQTKDINFAKLRDSNTSVSKVCPCMGTNGLSFNAKTYYDKLENYYIFGTNIDNWPTSNSGDGFAYSNTNNIYDGHGNEIQNLVVVSTANTGSGLFGKYNCKINDVHIRNIKVTASSSQRSMVGALVGYAGRYTHITNCGVYCTSINEDSSKFPYDTKLGAYSYSNYYIAGYKNVGGLVGAMEGSAKVENSFAAIDVRIDYDQTKLDSEAVADWNAFGGLVGRLSSKNGRILNCYASGKVQGTYDVGGIVGVSLGVARHCYSTSVITPTYVFGTNGYCAGGLIGKLMGSDAKVEYSYFLGSFAKYKKNANFKNSNIGVIVDRSHSEGETTRDTTHIKSCKYLEEDNYNDGFASGSSPSGYDCATSVSYVDLLIDSPAAGKSFPYKSSLKNKRFPFRMVSMLGGGGTLDYHYGDWYTEPVPVISPKMVYYEIYANAAGETTVGFNSATVKFNETGEIVKLPSICNQAYIDQGWYVLEAGYGILASETPKVKVSRSGSATQQLELGEPRTTFTLNNEEIELYSFNNTDYGETRGNDGNFYDTMKVGSEQYHYNCHVANAISEENGMPKTPSTVEIRTAKQFNNIANNQYLWSQVKKQQLNFVQPIDIDYSTYENGLSPTNIPIGNSSLAFTNNYDGRGNEINNYSLSVNASGSTNFVGTFGYVSSANISNLNLVGNGSQTIGATYDVSKKTTLGGLVGFINNGTISNCSVSGYNVVANNATNKSNSGQIIVGGLAGTVIGTVSKCTAVNKNVQITAYKIQSSYHNSIALGGLVGAILNGTADSCYTGGNAVISVANDVYNTNNDYIFVGGICAAGNTNNDSSGNSMSYNMTGVKVSSGKTNIKDCYSYCKYSTAVDVSTKTNIYGISYKTPTNCFYCSDTGYTKLKKNSSGSTAVTSVQLEGTSPNSSFGNADAQHSYPFSNRLRGKNYIYKAIVKDENNVLVHYGDWPVKGEEDTGKIGVIKLYNKSGVNYCEVTYHDFKKGSHQQNINVATYTSDDPKLAEILGSNLYKTSGTNNIDYTQSENLAKYLLFWNFEDISSGSWVYSGEFAKGGGEVGTEKITVTIDSPVDMKTVGWGILSSRKFNFKYKNGSAYEYTVPF